MKIDIKKIAESASIALTDKEIKEFTPQMEGIVDSMNVLKEVDTKGIKPMKGHMKFKDLREDIPGKTLSQEEVLKNAKYTENGCVKIYGDVFGSESGE
ncbi:MAG: Asp-tRNA(Asn)/Glu-tRNA(Gln) amidotransferase subunit GatC [Candidatus Dojkabacteria bacterium]|jgi:aspartyl-tRNA(Asn)/glutamyl-tRNA(Gln) amidotransferase subunit C